MAAVEGRVEALRRDGAQGTGAGHAGAGPSQAEADGSESGASGMGRKPPPRPRLRREYPDLVTLEPAEDDEDDEEVFGDAWPMIVEWRELKAAHPNEGKGLDWLRTEERFLALELALLEDHGMTLPPRLGFRCGASTATGRSTGVRRRSSTRGECRSSAILSA